MISIYTINQSPHSSHPSHPSNNNGNNKAKDKSAIQLLTRVGYLIVRYTQVSYLDRNRHQIGQICDILRLFSSRSILSLLEKVTDLFSKYHIVLNTDLRTTKNMWTICYQSGLIYTQIWHPCNHLTEGTLNCCSRDCRDGGALIIGTDRPQIGRIWVF